MLAKRKYQIFYPMTKAKIKIRPKVRNLRVKPKFRFWKWTNKINSILVKLIKNSKFSQESQEWLQY